MLADITRDREGTTLPVINADNADPEMIEDRETKKDSSPERFAQRRSET